MEKKSILTVKDMTMIGLLTAIIVICSWISLPFTVPFTLQTFAIMTAIGLLGRRNGTISILIYVLLGAVGLPVFAGFKGGLSALMGPTGGYIIGFIFSGILTGTLIQKFGSSFKSLFISMISGLVICYIFGTGWFMYIYTKNVGAVGLMTVLSWCIFPFIIPDLAKLALSSAIVIKLKKMLK